MIYSFQTTALTCKDMCSRGYKNAWIVFLERLWYGFNTYTNQNSPSNTQPNPPSGH